MIDSPDIYDRYQAVCEHNRTLLDTLARVMSTLSKSAGSPEETAVWREAWAVLAEYGGRTGG